MSRAGQDENTNTGTGRNIALRLAYDGTRYHGWQEQPRDVTVAGTLKDALRRICPDAGAITGCSRTDAGVHALRYCASFKTAASIPAERLPFALNTYLPRDIAVLDAVNAPEDFNAILSCEKKEYIYKIRSSRLRDPFMNGRAYFYHSRLDVEKMRRAARDFVGTRDFAAVRSVGTETKTTIRTVYHCELDRDGDELTVRICADGFLYNMARAIVGTLLYVSEGKIAPDGIDAILQARDRRAAGPTAPPQGLYLARVWYDGAVGEMMER
ncbi:MAG: tRNA pseudouridine(38-40) synthase TruA [Oscillospiraceae bacterium]|nr:tRNA pseudouridine(38-40) synthase TruA [Oscillospiraceae bacterium]